MDFVLRQLTKQINDLKQARDDLDDLIDDTYEQVDQRLVQDLDDPAVEELIDRIREWNYKRDELDDLLDRLYEKLDQYDDLYPGASSM
ncbi:hypothetical protein ACFOU2_08035 [Bacillus songklensis]|uniref:Uncharacterized protein n=1 Tax=Bacillus songklensis TaxID=1069116 RepID=A0ABV8B2Q3_9BACI